MSIWLPWRWWRVVARLLALQVVLTPAVLSPSLLLWLLLDADVVAGMAVTCVVIRSWDGPHGLGGREGPPPNRSKRVPGMVSITGLASRSGSAWRP